MAIALIGQLVLLLSGLPLQPGENNADAPEAASPQAEAVSARSDILSALPGNTWVALVVRDLDELDGKFASAAPVGGFTIKPVPFLKSWLGIVDGLDVHRPAAVVWLPTEKEQPFSMRLAVLLPTADRAALMTFWNPQPLDDGYFKVTLAGRESFLGTKGKFSVIAPNLETCGAIVESKGGLHSWLPAHTRRHFTTDDVSLWVNAAALSSSAWWDAHRSGLVGLLGVCRDLLGRYRSVYLGGALGDDGLALGLEVEQVAPSGDGPRLDTDEPLLRGLPAEPFAFAMGMVDDEAGRQVKALQSLIIPVLTGAGIINPDRAADIATMYETMAGRMAAVSACISILPDGAHSLVGLTKVVRTRGDSRALMDEIEVIVALLRGGPFVDPRLNAVAQRLVYHRAAETCNGLTVDHLLVEAPADQTEEYAGLRRVLGPEGLLWRMAVTDDRHVVVTLGGGLPRLKAAASAVRSGAAPLADEPSVAMAAGHLPARRSLEAYVSIDRLMRLANLFGAAMDKSIDAPETAEVSVPVALAVHTVAPGTTRVDVFVPRKTLAGRAAPPAATSTEK